MKSISWFRQALITGSFLGVVSSLYAQSVHVIIEVRPADGKAADATFLATQAEVIQKSEILLPVIQRYEALKDREQPEVEAVRILRDCLTVKTVGNSALLEIILSRPKGQGPVSDGVIASATLHELVKVYRERCFSDRKKLVEQKLSGLKDELERLKDKVIESSARAEEMRQRLKSMEPDFESSSELTGKFEKLESAIVEKTISVKQLSIRCEALGKLPPGEVMGSLEALGLADSLLQPLLLKLAVLETRESSLLASGTSEKDATVGRLRALRDAYRKKCLERQESILKGQRMALKVEQDTLAAFKFEIAELRKKAAASQVKAREYEDAKEECSTAKALLRKMEQKYTDLRSDQGVFIDPVTVWEHPVPFPPTPPR